MQANVLISLVGGAALVAGADLAGFQLAIDPTLLVVYGSTVGMGGAVVEKNATAQQPLLAVPAAVTASSLAIMMVDLDIPSSTQPTTFLHWLQTDLVASTTPETIMTSSGNLQGFGVNLINTTAAIINYTQPNPPAQNPLSHRYTQLLIDTSKITPAGLTALQTAAQSRVNFNINTTLQQAGLSQNVIAWNFFNVTNPGPVAAAANVATGAQSAKANADATTNSTATTGTGKKGDKAQKAKGAKGTAAAATSGASNSTATATGGKKDKGGVSTASAGNATTTDTGKKGDKAQKAKGAKGTAAAATSGASNSTATATGGKKNKGGVSTASAGNATTTDTGKKGGKKAKGAGADVTAQSNSTTADTGKKGGKKAKGAGNSTTTDTGNGGKKNKGGKGSNSTSASTTSPSSAAGVGSGTGVAAGAVTSNNSTAGTVTVSGSPEQRALHSVLLSLCLVGAAALAL